MEQEEQDAYCRSTPRAADCSPPEQKGVAYGRDKATLCRFNVRAGLAGGRGRASGSRIGRGARRARREVIEAVKGQPGPALRQLAKTVHRDSTGAKTVHRDSTGVGFRQ